MKKLLFTMFSAFGIISIAFAQSDSKIMASAGGGILAPACTNCSSLAGVEFAGGYAFTKHIVASLNLGLFSKAETGSKLKAFAVGISGDYYIKEAYKGFYVSPDLTLITLSNKYGGTTYSDNNFTVGLNLGWAIAIKDHFRIIPHFGYGTWFEDSKGRITAGLKIGYKI
ncbi:MAG: hypothetical protein ABI663_22190 [Chryseolinea sp.]